MDGTTSLVGFYGAFRPPARPLQPTPGWLALAQVRRSDFPSYAHEQSTPSLANASAQLNLLLRTHGTVSAACGMCGGEHAACNVQACKRAADKKR